MRNTVIATLLLTVAGCTSALPSPAEQATGSPARQLARGQWVRMPPAPIQLCYPQSAWDGRDLVVVEPGISPCPAAAATYSPRTNRWAKIAAPPRPGPAAALSGPEPLAWGGGRLLLVSPETGAAVIWSRATGQWNQAGKLPASIAVTATWTGTEFLVLTISKLGLNKGIARPFALVANRWRRLQDLPQPRTGRIVDAAMAAYRGAIYVLASINDTSSTNIINGSPVELLRRTASGWAPMRLAPGTPESQLMLTALNGAILAAGSACPPAGACMQEDGTAALLRPGARDPVVPLTPDPGVPYPWDIAAGGHVIVVVYSDGLGEPRRGPAPGSSTIYDMTTGKWLTGPTAPRTPAGHTGLGVIWNAYWTRYGVISLRYAVGVAAGMSTPGGWLLRPARLAEHA